MQLPIKHTDYFLAVLLFISISSCKTIQPNAPLRGSGKIPSIPEFTSQIIIPIKADLSNYFLMAEKSVPTENKGEENPCEGLRYAYLFKRGPLNFSGKDKFLKLSLNGAYQVSGSYCAKCAYEKCLLKTPTFSCGVHEPMRNISIGFISEVGLSSTYRLQTKTSVDFIQPIDPCKISFANIDITEKLVSQIRTSLQQLAAEVDIQTSTYPFRKQIEEVWNKLSGEFPAGELGYFYINPQSFSLSSIQFDGKYLNVQTGIRCQPAFSLKSEQQQKKPLPDMEKIGTENGFALFVDASLPYPELNRMAKRMLPDTTFVINGRSFHIDEISFMQAAENKLTTKIRFSGNKKGTIYLTGTPVLDTLKNEVSMPDLDFDIDSKNILVKSASWILDGKIEKKLRKKMIFPLSTLMASTKKEAETAMNRKLENGITLKGNINLLQTKYIYALPEKMIVRIKTTGMLSAEMK